MSLSDVVYHLSFIKWFFSIKTQKSSIFLVFYDDFKHVYINWFVNYLQGQVICKYVLSLKNYWRAPEVCARTNARAKTSKKYCKKITKCFWKSSLDVQNQMFLQKFVSWRNVLYMMKNPQTQVHMKMWTYRYIVTILYFGRSSLRQAEVVYGKQK